jgi:hypothetical protein
MFPSLAVSYIPSGTNILLSTLLSHILNQCSSVRARDHVSHAYKTTGKTAGVTYIVWSETQAQRLQS